MNTRSVLSIKWFARLVMAALLAGLALNPAPAESWTYILAGSGHPAGGAMDQHDGQPGRITSLDQELATASAEASRFAPQAPGDQHWVAGFHLPGMNSGVTALAVDGDGNLYAGGGFTTAGGTRANRIAKWDGTTWAPLGSGMDNGVSDLEVDNDGN